MYDYFAITFIKFINRIYIYLSLVLVVFEFYLIAFTLFYDMC